MSIRTPLTRHALPVLALLLVLAACGGGGGGGNDDFGTVSVSLSDPPVCEFPDGPFLEVWVTILRVEAHESENADPFDSGWVTLLDLTSDPLQIDLLTLNDVDCGFSILGQTTGVPAGSYEQIRLILLDNDPAPGTIVPSPNACTIPGVYNCVLHDTLGEQPLLLGSQAQTGLKVPRGQIAGGSFEVFANQTSDLNLDFDACRSIVQQGNGAFRLKPTLHAGEIAIGDPALTGRVVNALDGLPMTGIDVTVSAQIEDESGIFRIFGQTLADPSTGEFVLCPLPIGDYALVVSGESATLDSFPPLVVFDVPAGIDVGDLPLEPVGVAPAAEVSGGVFATGPGGADEIDASIRAITDVLHPQGGIATVTIPTLFGSVTELATADDPLCPPHETCAFYTVFVPALRPDVGLFTGPGFPIVVGSSDPAPYCLSIRAFEPFSGGVPACNDAELFVDMTDGGAFLDLIPGDVFNAEDAIFFGCD